MPLTTDYIPPGLLTPDQMTITNGSYQQVTPRTGPSQWYQYGRPVPSNPMVPQLPATPQVAPQNPEQQQQPNAPRLNPAPVPSIGPESRAPLAPMPIYPNSASTGPSGGSQAGAGGFGLAPGQSPLGLAVTNGASQTFNPYQVGMPQQLPQQLPYGNAVGQGYRPLTIPTSPTQQRRVNPLVSSILANAVTGRTG